MEPKKKRSRKDNPEYRGKFVTLDIHPALHDAARQMAADMGLSFTAFVRFLLVKEARDCGILFAASGAPIEARTRDAQIRAERDRASAAARDREALALEISRAREAAIRGRPTHDEAAMASLRSRYVQAEVTIAAAETQIAQLRIARLAELTRIEAIPILPTRRGERQAQTAQNREAARANG